MGFGNLGGSSSASSSSGSFGNLGGSGTPAKGKPLHVDTVNEVLTPVGNTAKNLVSFLGRAQQGIYGALRGAADANAKATDKTEADVSKINLLNPSTYAQAAKGALKGVEGKQTLTFAQTVKGKSATPNQVYGKANTPGGALLRAVDLTGSIATDPTTLIGSGAEAKVAGEVGLKAVGETAAKNAAEKVAAEHAVQDLARGTHAADQVTQLERQAAIKKAADEAAAKAINTAKTEGKAAGIKAAGGEEAVKQTLIDQTLATGMNPRRSLVEVLKGTPKTPEAYAETFANKAVTGLDRVLPGDVARALHIPQAEATVAAKLEPVQKAIANSGAARLVSNKARLAQDFGKEGGVGVKAAQDAQTVETMTRNAASNAGLKAAGKIKPVDEPVIAQAVREGDAGIARLQVTRPDLVDQANAVAQAHATGFAGEGQVGLKSTAEKLAKGTPQLQTKAFSQATRKPGFTDWLAQQPKNVQEYLAEGKKGVFQHQLDPVAVNKQLDASLRDAGLIGKNEHVMEEGLKPYMTSIRQANENIAQAHYVQRLLNTKTDGGSKIMYGGKMTGAEAASVPSNYKSVNLGPLGTFRVHPDIYNDVKNVRDVITNNKELSNLQRVYGKWYRAWKTGATMLPVGGTFIAKKAHGDIFNNYLAGIKNPVEYIDAGNLLHRVSKALSAPDAKQALIKGKYDQVLKDALSPEDYSYFTQMTKHNVFGSSFSVQDLALDMARSKTGKALAAPNAVLNKSRDIFQGVDTTARATHFIHMMKANGGDAEKAAASVKKYLFDYSDLTPAELRLRQTAIPFYTFMRKNTPLQVENLFKSTGKYTRLSHIGQAAGFTGPSEDVPNYQADSVRPPTIVSRALGLNPETAIETPTNPLEAASTAISPALAFPSLIPGIRGALPAEFQAKDKADAARQIANIPGGPVYSAILGLVSEGEGKSTFSGAALKPGNMETAKRIASYITPAAGRVESVQKQKTRAAILKLLTAVKVGEETQK